MQANEKQMADILSDPDWLDVGNLPSNFYPYDFKTLYIKPFTAKHLRLLSKTVVTKVLSYQMRAVDLVISQDVNKISIGDYYYLLEWLKVHSSPKTPLTVEWHCQEQRLKHKVTGEYILNDPKSLEVARETVDPEDYILEPCGCHCTESLHMADLEVLQLPEEDWVGLPEGFDFPRVSILADQQAALLDSELNMLVGAASWVAGSTFEDKVKTLEDSPTLDMFYTAQALNDTLAHGISQTAVLHCRECRAEHKTKLAIDTASFFR